MRDVLIGQTDYSVLVKIVGTDGAPETGLTEASIDLAYSRVETDNDVTTTDVTPAALSALTDAHTDWGFEEVSATDHPGLYRLDIADAVFASGAWEAVVTIVDASGTDFYAVDIGFRLVSFNAQDGVRLGLTALPNAAADGVGGLPISDAGGLDLDGIKTKTDFLPSATAGASGGVLIAGSNAATTFASATITGELTISNGVVVTCSTTDKQAFTITGNGSGRGIVSQGGGTAPAGSGFVGGVNIANGAIAISSLLTGTYTHSAASLRTALGLASANLDTQLADLPTAGENADAVWDEPTLNHTGSGTFGEQAKTDIDAILADTGTDGVVVASGSKTGYSLASTGLDLVTAWTVAITGNITGNVSGSVGSLAAQAKADVNAEVLDVLNVDTFAEPGQEAPAATNTLVKKIGYLFKAWRNKKTQTSTTHSLFNDDATTVDQKSTISDDGTTFTEGEVAGGP